METHVKDNIESLFKKTGDYIETRADLYKLKAIDKSTDVLSSLLSKLIVYIVFCNLYFFDQCSLIPFYRRIIRKSLLWFFSNVWFIPVDWPCFFL